MVKLDKDIIAALVITIIAIIGIIVIVITTFTSKEAFSKAQRIKLLSKASMKDQEGFVGSRADMMFKGQFDYLKQKVDDVEKPPATSVPTMDSTPATSVPPSSQLSATPAEASAVATDIAKSIASGINATISKPDVGVAMGPVVHTPTSYELNNNVETHNEIVSTAGKPLSQEKFGQARIYNDFSTLLVDPSMNRLSSQVAQSEDQSQKSVDMKAFEKKL